MIERCKLCAQGFNRLLKMKTCRSCANSVCAFCSRKRNNCRFCKTCEVCLRKPVADVLTVAKLPDFESTSFTRRALSRVFDVDRILSGQSALLVVNVIAAKGLIGSDWNMVGRKSMSDPYCIVSIDKEQLSVRTSVVAKTLSPAWDTEFQINLKFPTPAIVLSVYDQEKTQKDPFLGRAIINTSGAESGVMYTGWVPLAHSKKPNAGMVKLSFTLHYTQSSYLLGFIRRRQTNMPSSPTDFDIHDIYLSWSVIEKTALSSITLPAVKSLVDILMWTKPHVSIAFLFLWYPMTYYLTFWPAALCALVAIYTGSKVGTSKVRASKGEEQSTRAAIVEFITNKATANILPSSLQKWAAGMQDTLRSIALLAVEVYDMLHGASPNSVYFRIGFSILSLVFLIIPLRWLLYVTGFTVLVLTSPASGFALGVFDFLGFQRTQHPPPKMHAAFDFDLLSNQAQAMKV